MILIRILRLISLYKNCLHCFFRKNTMLNFKDPEKINLRFKKD